MRYMATHDLMESFRNASQWMGASALSMASYPVFSMLPNPAFQWVAAWGEVTERSFERMIAKPDWGIRTFTCEDGKDHLVNIDTVVSKPFGDLIHFNVSGRKEQPRKVLLVAPMSGHYATLLRATVKSLLVNCEVYVTDWHNARDIPVSEGKFDIEDYTLYLVDFMRELGPDVNVVAVCQPAPLALAATAYLAELDPDAQPQTLTLIGGPIDPDATPTDVTDFGRRVTMGQLEETMIQRIGFKYKGVGRQVYPGMLQLASFISMNAERHAKAFTEQICASPRARRATTTSTTGSTTNISRSWTCPPSSTSRRWSGSSRGSRSPRTASRSMATRSISARSPMSRSRPSRAARTTSRPPVNAWPRSIC